MEYIDESPLGPEGILNSEQAVLSGKMKVSDVEDLKRFDAAFPMDPRKVLAVAEKYKDRIESGDVTPKEKFNVIFRELLPGCFDAERAEDWTSVLHFDLNGGGQFTINVSDGKALIENGLIGEPTCTVQTDAETFSAVIRFEVLEDASEALPSRGDGTRARAVLKMVNESASEELSDEALELVAGGKGEAGGSGATASPLACIDSPDNSSDCPLYQAINICEPAACGAAECGTVACTAAACGAALCAVDLGAGSVCPAQACVVDVGIGPDIGPCLVNLVPFVPGT